MPFGRKKKKNKGEDVNQNGDKVNASKTLTYQGMELARALSLSIYTEHTKLTVQHGQRARQTWPLGSSVT